MINQPNGPNRPRINLTPDEYATTDITLAAVLLDQGIEMTGIEPANFSKQRARWVFDDRDGQATEWASAYYDHPETLTISIAALRQGTKLALRIAKQHLS